MSNSNYSLEMGTFNMASGKSTNASSKLGFSMGQTTPGQFSGTNYKIRSGFQYIYTATSAATMLFSFSIDQTSIDFGTLSATEPVTRTNKLTVSNGSAPSYSVTAFENHELLVPGSAGTFIPDTTCDNGLCNETSSAPWANTLTYGFGYRCDNDVGTDCTSGFSNSTFYKQFADNSKSETPQTVMNGTSTSPVKVKITYKVNISGMQAAGSYGNVITYIATPTF